MEGTYFLKQTCSVLSCYFFSFLTDAFILTRTVHFMTPLSIFQTHFFCFCKTCFFRASSDVAGRNIFLIIIYIGMASKPIRCSVEKRINSLGLSSLFNNIVEIVNNSINFNTSMKGINSLGLNSLFKNIV